ncbi:hypothetical protein CsSME_00000396 [Camellia sinensis var. sinensis]
MALGYSFHRTTVFEIFAVEFDISEPIHSFFYIPNRNHVGLEMETSRFVIFFEFSYLPPLIDILRRIVDYGIIVCYIMCQIMRDEPIAKSMEDDEINNFQASTVH